MYASAPPALCEALPLHHQNPTDLLPHLTLYLQPLAINNTMISLLLLQYTMFDANSVSQLNRCQCRA
jgi:hypothetical protein